LVLAPGRSRFWLLCKPNNPLRPPPPPFGASGAGRFACVSPALALTNPSPKPVLCLLLGLLLASGLQALQHRSALLQSPRSCSCAVLIRRAPRGPPQLHSVPVEGSGSGPRYVLVMNGELCYLSRGR
jgi:hypothetical protein